MLSEEKVALYSLRQTISWSSKEKHENMTTWRWNAETMTKQWEQ